jgi:UDP-glucose:(heptosyl)LPS alpha-1,3-glucosyltransferase
MSDVTIVALDVGGIGGMELQLGELVRGLVAAGDHVTVIARTTTVADGSVSFHRVRGPARPFVIAYPWFALRASLLLRRHRRGIVQATGAIVFNRVDLIAVHYCHRAVGRRTGASTASRNTVLFRAHAHLAHALSLIAERLCLRPTRVRGVIAVSAGVGAEVRACYPDLAHHVTVIANGVDRTRFAPASSGERIAARARLGLPSVGPAAAFVGGDWGRKGLREAIEALAQADGWQLIVAGRGDAATFRELAQRAGVSERVHFLGTISDTPSVYQAADALVLPSAYETFSLVAYEAAASGLPLIATAVSGIEDILVDGVSGYRVGRDAGEIARSMRRLSDASTLAREMGAAARRMTADYTWETMVARHRALYAHTRADPARTLSAPR